VIGAVALPGRSQLESTTRAGQPWNKSGHDGEVVRMKIRLNVGNDAARRLKREAIDRDRTMAEIVEAALRLFFSGTDATGASSAADIPLAAARLCVPNPDALFRTMETNSPQFRFHCLLA
jgi:hypothetical protein